MANPPDREEHHVPGDGQVRDHELGSTAADTRPTSLVRPSHTLHKVTSRVGEEQGAEGRTAETALPGLLPIMGASVLVGTLAGFLELALVLGQYHGLHQVRWSTLMMNRHASWMIPVAETLLVCGWSLLLFVPARLLASRFCKSVESREKAARFLHDWAGLVLGTFLLFGPLLTISGLHALAALVLALGLGFRLRTLLVRPTRLWRRNMQWGGALALAFLLAYSLVQENRVNAAPSAAWSRPETPAGGGEAPASRPNLLWIVMDTVRADHLSLYGYSRPTTPNLEALAGSGITFDQARSSAPWTLPAHMTMFTGLWPYQHGARVDRPYHGQSPMLAEHLRANGYTTGGIVANVRVCNANYGFGRGFDSYLDYPRNQVINLNETLCNSTLGEWTMNLLRRAKLPVPGPSPYFVHRSATEITADARSWLDQVQSRNANAEASSTRPYFLFLNFMDAHGPYIPAPNRPRKFWHGPTPSQAEASPVEGWTAVESRNNATPDQLPARQQKLDEVTQRLTDLYDECLYGLDAELGRFLDELRSAGLLDNTWIVLTSDHGEHFGEHGHFGHGSTLYNESTHVPLMIIPPSSGKASRVSQGKRIDAPVAHRDLPRTMSELLLPGVPSPFPGRSLARHWQSSTPQAPDPILAQLEKQPLDGKEVQTDLMMSADSLIDADHVLIETSNAPTELYQLFNDPKQARNLATETGEIKALRARMEKGMRTILADPNAASRSKAR